jgi:hypothetical protein
MLHLVGWFNWKYDDARTWKPQIYPLPLWTLPTLNSSSCSLTRHYILPSSLSYLSIFCFTLKVILSVNSNSPTWVCTLHTAGRHVQVRRIGRNAKKITFGKPQAQRTPGRYEITRHTILKFIFGSYGMRELAGTNWQRTKNRKGFLSVNTVMGRRVPLRA